MGSPTDSKGDSEKARESDAGKADVRTALVAGLGCILLGALLGFGVARLGTEEPAAGYESIMRGTALSFILGGGALGALVFVGALRCRGLPDAEQPYAGAPRWESSVALAVLAGLIGLAWYADAAERSVFRPEADGGRELFHVEVLARQFEWIVRYPGPDGQLGRVAAERIHSTLNPMGLNSEDPAALDDIVRRGLLRLPLGRDCVIHLRSLDVIHGFNIHGLRVNQDILPGYPTRVDLRCTAAGSFEIACAALCGLGHYRMRGKLEVLPEAEFEEWLAGEEPWL